MDLRKIKTLIDLVSDSNIAELEITESEGTVRIVKSQPLPASSHTALAQTAIHSVSSAKSVGDPAIADAMPNVNHVETASVVPAPANTNHTLKSPMVGTFYNASSPEAKPFISVGDTVKQGQTVCIIEAMKILNEIEADRSGVVLKVLVDNAQGVEFGQPLFEIA